MSTTTNQLVMLVDDSKIDLFLNRKFLNVAGISANTLDFLSAKEALQYIEENAKYPDKLPLLILLDVKMPEINGFQFLEHYKKIKQNIKKDIKIIMLSSTIDPVDLNRARDNEHVFDILKKPLNPNVLKEALKAQKIKWVA
ncbi:MAG: response regulator [Chitinophagales bacterium]